MNIMTLGHPTNIAKLFHTTYQNAEEQGYFNYYILVVGTPFPKIGEMDYSNSGLEFATGEKIELPGHYYASWMP